ncbi:MULTISPECIES: hypothetical protein [Mycobacterium]|uniref:Uncharacterized protein n=1 Tax=Mycobacterium kiyosense TaxID=2871094 RepID=A0A9P3Q5G4_9MYCO|nr:MULTISPECIES: hypothetical protein [Mycobacterium]BDB44015.1 hypothetical protein IWGMT90018_44610 [Mycobacterium kiyosense]BDE15558.1 hypothetical protein MKCMC460_44180 [Mycobacterium sp. 20KCMC460]GLB81019.1 hypothetical protein SRL2020028_02750 [Mycobacterium kiyosense]GLB87221.1 hypothetical protein SRL2020130_00380 [Mycobacterium kiyosense]GLB93499.1 hypothetical protein SRL2020226_02750 [Mycobacterium kiyosense]
MMQYSVDQVFGTLDNLDPRAFIGLALASTGYYVQYVSSVRKGFRDRIHGTPVACNMWNFADDFIYLCLFARWFGRNPYSHWFTIALWFGMAIWVSLELMTHYQTIKYSLAELIPTLGRGPAVALYLGAQLAMFVLMIFFINLVDDPILLLAIVSTQFTSVAFAIPMLLGRGHRRGISTAAARAMLVAPAAFLTLFLPAVAPQFDTAITYLAAAACFVTALAYNLLLRRYPVESRATAPLTADPVVVARPAARKEI